ncbi:YgiQ family radical SAM protein [Clostridium sp. KNHs205]|uniref:YgiQ family radical SAM protein n=1 Tax=Clostridium sp. KNHs205 TaxID=1449050 RepID=UPI0009DE7B2D|nr:YgiQ family radical SAM protein [Clostridium sp. KNHs205]
MIKDFLPICREDMDKRGWEQCDFVYITGDAYVDHHSFGPAIISRVLESNGFKVGIIAQPDWKNEKSIQILGEPRLGFLVSGGNMDTMVNHYTVAKKKRNMDYYTPGGVMGKRPDRATICYSNLIRKVYKNAPIIIGGIEASLRRLGHYDYWSDTVKRSILLDSQADLLSYGMGERSIVEIAEALDSGLAVSDITFINGTVYKARSLDSVYDAENLPDYAEIVKSKLEFAKSFNIQYCNTDPYSGKRLVEKYKETEYVVQNPPAKPLTQAEMDRVYSLPYMRDYHPSYIPLGGIPAIEELKFSLVSNRGCFGGCSFCALTFHQGRIIQTRSHESIMAEANHLIWDKDFKGYINDIGGPTANFRHTACEKQNTKGACVNKQCLFPTPCKNLKVDHKDYLSLLKKLRELPGVKKVFIRSGIRFDYLIADKDETFMKELCEHHISGQLKVAPEHISDSVLDLMGKPKNAVYEDFKKKYKKTNEELGKKQFVVPYLMSSHPGSTIKEAIALAEYLRDLGYMPEQVQDFYPTPSTISTCMYYTGLDPRNLKQVYVPKTPHEKAMQRALIQYRNPKNYDLVEEALTLAGRRDLIGFDKNCLIKPRGNAYSGARKEKGSDKQGQSRGRSTENRQQTGSRASKNQQTKNQSGKNQQEKNQAAKYQQEKIQPARNQQSKNQQSKNQPSKNQGVKNQSAKQHTVNNQTVKNRGTQKSGMTNNRSVLMKDSNKGNKKQGQKFAKKR